MADDVENHTLRLLQEMRAEMRESRDELRAEIHATRDELRAEVHATRDEARATRDELRAEMSEMRAGMGEMRAEMGQGFARIESLEGRVHNLEASQLEVLGAIKAMAKVQEQHTGLLLELVEAEQIAGSRLNAVDARLGRIEKRVGLVPA